MNLEVVFSGHTTPPHRGGIACPSWVQWLQTHCIRETYWTNTTTFEIQEVRWVIRYPLHSHHWGPIQIHVSSSSTKTTVTIRCRCNHSPYRLRVIVMFPRPTENISPPIFSFGGNSSLWNRQTAKSLRVQPVFILVPLHQPRVPLRFCVPRLTEVYWPTHPSLFGVTSI